MKLSLCMIVKDEEDNIRECLKNIRKAVDEIIVVDTGSSDKTPVIAEELGAKVYHFRWCNDFSAARNESIRHATGDYIIYIDADDRISEDDAEKIADLRNKFPKKKDIAYSLKIMLPSPEKILNSAYQVRIFPNLPDVRFEYPIHEQIVPSLKRKGIRGLFTDIVIEHKGYEDYTLLRKKAKRNLRILKELLSKDPDSWFAHYFLAQTYEVLNEKELCEFHIKNSLTEECKKLDPNWFIGASLKYSQLLTEKGDRKAAIELLRKLEEEFPDHDIVRFFIAEMDMEEGNYREALNRYITVRPEKLSLVTIPISEDKIRYKYYLHIGQCNEAVEYNRLAMDAYKKAYELAYTSEFKKEALIKIIRLFIKMDKLGEAIPYMEKYAELHPSARSYNLLALGYMKEGLYEMAENSLKDAISIDPRYWKAILKLAELYIQTDKFPKAEEILNELLENRSIDKQHRLTVLLMLAFIHVSRVDLEGFLHNTDLILKHLNIRASVGSFQDLYYIYERISEQFGGLSQIWIESIKKYLNMLSTGGSFSLCDTGMTLF